MSKIVTYLNFPGNCEEAFSFYQSVLGGTVPYLGRFGDMPPQEGMPPLPEEVKNKIMHMSLVMADGTTLMGSDFIEGFGPAPVIGNNFSLSVDTSSKEEADKVFAGLSEGGQVTMPLSDTFWGAYFGMWVDKFGINWMVNYDDPAKQQKHP